MHSAVKPFAGMVRLGARMAADARGAAAVEFAALLPFMLLLYIGGVEVAQGVSADRRVTQTSRTIADLASRQTSLATADVSTILQAASAVMAPFVSSDAQVIVSQVCVGANGKAAIQWSQASSNATAHTVGASVPTLPTALATPNTWLIWGEATYLYTPTIGYYMTGTLTMYDNIFMAPRMSQYVQLNGVPASSTTCP